LSGTCELGATITLKLYDLTALTNLTRANSTIRSQGTATCVAGGTGLPGTGIYSVTPTVVTGTGLLNQMYIVEAISTDLNGNVSSSTTSPNWVYGFRVDTVLPTTTFTFTPAAVANLTKNNKQPITGTCEAGSLLNITINGSGSGSMAGTGFGSATLPPAAPSTATVETSPVAPAPGNVVCSGTYPTTNVAVPAGTFSYTPATAIPDGNYSVTVTATDPATNTTSPLIRTNGNVDTVNYVSLVISPTNTINNNLITLRYLRAGRNITYQWSWWRYRRNCHGSSCSQPGY
jgi:large repetitive protein